VCGSGVCRPVHCVGDRYSRPVLGSERGREGLRNIIGPARPQTPSAAPHARPGRPHLGSEVRGIGAARPGPDFADIHGPDERHLQDTAQQLQLAFGLWD
jgi:hypothetical protein